ncbi:MAG: hypothetical protein OEZ34_15260, partial [Spirochaetia bacterium]|nr:hypothetical protein [Spirochaetia bacterium]
SSMKLKREFFRKKYRKLSPGKISKEILSRIPEEQLEMLWKETEAPGTPDMKIADFVLRSPYFKYIPVRLALEFSPHYKPIQQDFLDYQEGMPVDAFPLYNENGMENHSGVYGNTAFLPYIKEVLRGDPMPVSLRIHNPGGYLVTLEALNEIGHRNSNFFLSLEYMKNFEKKSVN